MRHGERELDIQRKSERDSDGERQRETERRSQVQSGQVRKDVYRNPRKIVTKKILTKKQVRKDVKDRDTSIYEYRNGSLWWSRETNSTILDATRPAVGVAVGGGAKPKYKVRFPLCFTAMLVDPFFFLPQSPSRFYCRMSSAITCVLHARDTLCCLCCLLTIGQRAAV